MYLESLENIRSIVFFGSEKLFKSLNASIWRHGKSPCFSRCSVLTGIGVDERVLVSVVADGVFFLD